MKHSLPLLFLTGAVFVLLAGCDSKIIDETKSSYDNLVTEVTETKEKIEETVNDIKTAKDEIDQASSSVSEIFE